MSARAVLRAKFETLATESALSGPKGTRVDSAQAHNCGRVYAVLSHNIKANVKKKKNTLYIRNIARF